MLVSVLCEAQDSFHEGGQVLGQLGTYKLAIDYTRLIHPLGTSIGEIILYRWMWCNSLASYNLGAMHREGELIIGWIGTLNFENEEKMWYLMGTHAPWQMNPTTAPACGNIQCTKNI